MKWSDMKKENEYLLLNSIKDIIVRTSVKDAFGKTNVFKYPDDPFLVIITKIKQGKVQEVKELVMAFRKMKEHGYPEDIIELIEKGDFWPGKLKTGELFGALWWLTFQSSGAARLNPNDSYKDIAKKWDQKLESKEEKKNIWKEVYELGYNEMKQEIKNYRDIHHILVDEFKVDKYGKYAGNNIQNRQPITEKQCVDFLLSNESPFVKIIRGGIKALGDENSKKNVIPIQLHMNVCSLANTIDFAINEYNYTLQDILDKLEGN